MSQRTWIARPLDAAGNPRMPYSSADTRAAFTNEGGDLLSRNKNQTAPALHGFDPVFYLRENPDVASARIDPTEHFLSFGWREGRDPSPFFSTKAYLAANPEVATSGRNPLLHFLEEGFARGLLPLPAGKVQNSAARALVEGITNSVDLDGIGWLAAGVSSNEYVLERMDKAFRAHDNRQLLEFALQRAPADGLYLEFGVYSGGTINFIAERIAGTVDGFDSFKGLPDDWRPGFGPTAFARDDIPEVRANVNLHVGWFDRTLPPFLDAHPGRVAFLHVDCDLYSSTQTVFAQLKDRVQPGTVIVFDEYLNYPGWKKHEHKAFKEFCSSYNVSYKYIGLVPSAQQVAVIIDSIGL